MRNSLNGVLLAAAFAGLGLLAPGCGAEGPREGERDEGERLGRVAARIVGSRASDASQDSVVMLVFSDPAANRRGICTAVLVAPRLVLTARHCVSDTDADVSCSVEGDAVSGGAVRVNHDPRKLYVLVGKDRPDLDPATWKPEGRGAEVLDDGSENLCNHDLAFVLLDQPIVGTPIASVRLDGEAEKGERLTTVGWGVTSDVDEPTARQQRSGVVVTRVGPDRDDPILTPNEFAFDESICLGDSGGPIFSESTGAVVGVVSRGGNGRSSTDLASTCTKATNLGTKIAPFKDVVTRAFERAGAAPQREKRKSDDGGCATARGRPSGPNSTLLAACLALLGLAGCWRRGARRRA